MNLINEEVTHEIFGEGNIVDHDESVISIDFNEGVKKFVYPDAFGKFITLNDSDSKKHLQKVISQKKEEEAEREELREEEKRREALDRERREKLKNHKIHGSSQIVFWLDDEQENVFTDWQVFTGYVQSGKSKGQPNRVARLRPNSAILLTAREPDQAESERQILGLYMVKDTFSGQFNDDGIIPSHEDFKIELTEQEAQEMLFWNYYFNKNYPHRMTWNSGKYRYFDNIWTAQILEDIIALKTDEEQIQYAKNFLEYFCDTNLLEADNIPEANGALKQ